MDRNRDGDVSRREFLGPREQFDHLDRDKDGLIDSDEAANAAKAKSHEGSVGP
jgi:Ca2+-binding EF-hand superfamily protein